MQGRERASQRSPCIVKAWTWKTRATRTDGGRRLKRPADHGDEAATMSSDNRAVERVNNGRYDMWVAGTITMQNHETGQAAMTQCCPRGHATEAEARACELGKRFSSIIRVLRPVIEMKNGMYDYWIAGEVAHHPIDGRSIHNRCCDKSTHRSEQEARECENGAEKPVIIHVVRVKRGPLTQILDRRGEAKPYDA